MNSFARILLVVLVMSVAAVGCGRKGRVSTSELQSSFQSSEPALQSLVDKAVAAVKSNNYPEALNNLQILARKAKETPDQQQAVKDTIEAIQKRIAETGNKVPEAPKTVPKQPQRIPGFPN